MARCVTVEFDDAGYVVTATWAAGLPEAQTFTPSSAIRFRIVSSHQWTLWGDARSTPSTRRGACCPRPGWQERPTRSGIVALRQRTGRAGRPGRTSLGHGAPIPARRRRSPDVGDEYAGRDMVDRLRPVRPPGLGHRPPGCDREHQPTAWACRSPRPIRFWRLVAPRSRRSRARHRLRGPRRFPVRRSGGTGSTASLQGPMRSGARATLDLRLGRQSVVAATDGGSGATTTYTYDDLQWLASRTDALGQTETYDYDPRLACCGRSPTPWGGPRASPGTRSDRLDQREHTEGPPTRRAPSILRSSTPGTRVTA